ncbi:MAG: hypothetical protein EOO74_05530, partial [Myxococcales bacterium]
MGDDVADERPGVRQGLVLTGIGLLLICVLFAVLVPWDWLPGVRGGVPDVAPGDVFSPSQIDRAEAFAWPQRLLGWSSLAVSLLVTGALGFTRLGRRLVRRTPGPWWVATPLVVLAVLAAGEVATLPLSWWSRIRAVEAGLSTSST